VRSSIAPLRDSWTYGAASRHATARVSPDSLLSAVVVTVPTLQSIIATKFVYDFIDK